MKKHLLIIGICIVILFIPISSAVNVDTNVDDDARENFEIETFDSYSEIITFISGTCDSREIKGTGLFRDVKLVAGAMSTSLTVWGYKHPFFDWQKLRVNRFAEQGVMHIHASRCICIFGGTSGLYGVSGIALGNIEWS